MLRLGCCLFLPLKISGYVPAFGFVTLTIMSGVHDPVFKNKKNTLSFN